MSCRRRLFAGMYRRSGPSRFRRFLSRGTSADIDFLFQNQFEGHGSDMSRARLGVQGSLHDMAIKKDRRYDGAAVESALRHAVLCKNTAGAEEIFHSNLELHTSPRALRWMLRCYTSTYDFTTAKAFLLRVLPWIRSKGIYQYMKACFRVSENAADLHDIFFEAIKLDIPRHEIEILAATAMFGFRILKDRVRADEVLSYCRDAKIDRSPPLLQVAIYDDYLAGNYSEALQLGRVVIARYKEERPCRSRDRVAFNRQSPYRWAVWYYAKVGDMTALDTLFGHMVQLNLVVPTTFTNTLLTFLPRLYPDVDLLGWFQLCRERSWPLNIGSIMILVDNLASFYPVLAKQLTARRIAVCREIENLLPHNGKWSGSRPAEPVIQTSRSPFLRSIRSFLKRREFGKCFEVLDGMRRQGLVPSYYYYVSIFEVVARKGTHAELASLKARMEAVGYPLHCAGTDLAILEQVTCRMHGPTAAGAIGHSADAIPNIATFCSQLIDDYLLQYPLNLHDREQLTRLGHMLLHKAHRVEDALSTVDFLRLQTPDQRYTARNHDSASLQLVLKLRRRLGLDVVPWVRSILEDRPLILFDETFCRSIDSALLLAGQISEPIRNALDRHNKIVEDQVLKQVDSLGRVLCEAYQAK